MKKIFIGFLILLSSLFFISCSNMKEYTDKRIAKLTYITIDYMGGYTVEKVLDFNENKYYKASYLPEEERKLEVKKEFTDEDEKILIDSCYSYGLFNIKNYYSEDGIIDGGGWNLIIDYEDNTSKISRGSNDGPTKVFNDCAIFFYDICGEEVIGMVPYYYINQPKVSLSFRFSENNSIGAIDNSFTKVIKANYKWNKSLSLDNDIYLINEEVKFNNKFDCKYNYKLVLWTSNYDYKEKFNKITVKSYDFNNELTNENIIYSGKWFDQIELDLEFNKIYVYELNYKNGDFVQYTFNTYCK